MQNKTHHKAVISLTQKAANRIIDLVRQSNSPQVDGIRVSVKSGGCSGLSYSIEYSEGGLKFDEVVHDKGAKVYVDPKALLHLIGSEMDYSDDPFKSGFVFVNPNAKASCGCGKSFSA